MVAALSSRLIVAAAALAMTIAALPPAVIARPRSCNRKVAEIRSLIAAFRTADVPQVYDAGRALDRYARNAPKRCAPAIVPPLVELLRDDNDMMRLYAAGALSDIGPPARKAVPALEHALRLDKCVCYDGFCSKQSLTSTAWIRDAMTKITGSEGDPAMYQCSYSGSVPMKR
jgi:hypothetical protein